MQDEETNSRSYNLALLLQIRMFSQLIIMEQVAAWTLTETTFKKLAVIELWVYRRMFHISWVERISNDEVLEQFQKKWLKFGCLHTSAMCCLQLLHFICKEK